MCGIIGIRGNSSVTQPIIDGEFAFQHRGSDSAGLGGYNRETDMFSRFVGKGTVQEVYRDFNPKLMPVHVGVGQVRYVTSGFGKRRDAQPLLLRQPPLIIAHNGQVGNVTSMREKFHRRWMYMTECDVEHILFSLAEQLDTRKHYKAGSIDELVQDIFFPSVAQVFEEVTGGYSVVGVFGRHGLFAFKDPHGIRPLSYAEQDGMHVFASETASMEFLQMRNGVHELEPGEAMFVADDGKVYSTIIKQERSALCMYEPVYNLFPNSSIEGIYAISVRKNSAREFVMENPDLLKRIDVIVDCPTTATPEAEEISLLTGIYHSNTGLRKEMKRGYQQGDDASRMLIASRKFSINIKDIRGKRVLVVDDSNNRGNTGKVMAQLLWDADAAEVNFAYMCPPITHPCPYGNDHSIQQELIAHRNDSDLDRIAKELNATRVYYLSLPGLHRALERPANQHCFGCITGEYPTEENTFQEYLKLRIQERNGITTSQERNGITTSPS
jgi:amidophosphoribosyltransferase